MFGLFKKKSKIDKLNSEYQKLLSEAHKLSSTNRRLSDAKVGEADEILKQIELLTKND